MLANFLLLPYMPVAVTGTNDNVLFYEITKNSVKNTCFLNQSQTQAASPAVTELETIVLDWLGETA